MPRWKYDFGDQVWFNAYGNRPTSVKITGLLLIGDNTPGYQLRESDGGYVCQTEAKVYPNRETCSRNINRKNYR
jgi:hypothetical protein